MSYAQVAQQTRFPTREQAIVLDSMEVTAIQAGWGWQSQMRIFY